MPHKDKDELPFFTSEKERIQIIGTLHSHRRVLVSGELNSKSLKKTSLELVTLDFRKTEPITILLESGGGDVEPTLQLRDIFTGLNSPVDVIVMGKCCSMAVDLVQMCRRRKMMASARLLVHYIRSTQTWICDDMERLELDLKYFQERIKELYNWRKELYQKRTGLSAEKLAEIFRHGEVHQTSFSATQALELGLVDEIVTDFKFFPRKPEEEKV